VDEKLDIIRPRFRVRAECVAHRRGLPVAVSRHDHHRTLLANGSFLRTHNDHMPRLLVDPTGERIGVVRGHPDPAIIAICGVGPANFALSVPSRPGAGEFDVDFRESGFCTIRSIRFTADRFFANLS
jgi:hypothetical protein